MLCNNVQLCPVNRKNSANEISYFLLFTVLCTYLQLLGGIERHFSYIRQNNMTCMINVHENIIWLWLTSRIIRRKMVKPEEGVWIMLFVISYCLDVNTVASNIWSKARSLPRLDICERYVGVTRSSIWKCSSASGELSLLGSLIWFINSVFRLFHACMHEYNPI